MLNRNDFKDVVKNTNLLAFDLIIRNYKNEVLIAKRNNSPAKGFWFVPGGRVFKNENLNDAFARILKSELGLLQESFKSIKAIGLYNHIYKDNAFEDETFNTHYIVYAIECILDKEVNILIDSQHSEYQFFTESQIRKNDDVHLYTRSYFLNTPANIFEIKKSKKLVV